MQLLICINEIIRYQRQVDLDTYYLESYDKQIIKNNERIIELEDDPSKDAPFEIRYLKKQLEELEKKKLDITLNFDEEMLNFYKNVMLEFLLQSIDAEEIKETIKAMEIYIENSSNIDNLFFESQYEEEKSKYELLKQENRGSNLPKFKTLEEYTQDKIDEINYYAEEYHNYIEILNEKIQTKKF